MPKGFEGWIRLEPNTSGWGTFTAPTDGHYIFADSEALGANQEFKDRPEKITFGMPEKLNSRTVGPQKPGGDLTFQPRTNDSAEVFMSHFQKYIGTQLGSTGTSIYTFVPCRTQPDWVGSSWGTGAYTAAEGDMFCFTTNVKFNIGSAGTNDTKQLKNCFADSLTLESAAGEDLKMTAGIKAGTIILAVKGSAQDPPNATYGSYSELSAFEFFEGTMTVGGRTDLEITNFSLTSSRNSEDRPVLGQINPSKYDFGRYTCEGVVQVDAPSDVLSHMGSMLSDNVLAISGTWYNSTNDYLIVSLPNCKYQPFDTNISAGDAQTEYGLAFKSYESNDGATSPLTVTMKTMGLGSVFDIV